VSASMGLTYLPFTDDAKANGSSTLARAFRLRDYSLYSSTSKSADAGASTKKKGTKTRKQSEEQQSAAEDGATPDSAAAGASTNVEELGALLKEKDERLSQLEEQLSEAKEKVVYTLADMENLRQRTNRQMEEARKFALQDFAKNIFDVADNLERSAGAVPEEFVDEAQAEELGAEKIRRKLEELLSGVQLTEKTLQQILQQNGIDKISPPLGERFDPNFHKALFEVDDPEREPGTISMVTKAGYVLNGRVIRPADVGVVRGESS